MITNIKITDKETKNILLFDKIQNLKPLNILVGGNGVGKSTLLNAIKNNKIEFKTEVPMTIKYYCNSLDNFEINKQRREFGSIQDIAKKFNSSKYSEGQGMVHYLLSFLESIKEIENVIILMDEIDSGMSVENLNMILWLIKELIDEDKNRQFFISTNNYHFTYAVKNVLNMYNGKFITINSYDEYFKLMQDGIQVLNNSGKRKFDFLKVY